MISFLEFLRQRVQSVADRAFLEEAPEDADWPYVVLKLPSSVDEHPREDFILEVDIWSVSTIAEIESIAGQVDRALNRHYHNAAGFQCCIYRINRLTLPDPDSRIRRRQLRYQVQTYFKE